ncbi:hypothetical protein EV361DRAFT_370675 [Lentinula raphanica]|uniref:Uncharacterized protein n=1 Tax=Lentinula raphanica TaxID=153919 RepID=A0AA38UHY8_9AGAR|nr:hypothetical protein EV360DRAFT_80727 [Lentinula raphanica]KAJ3767490.1 hypothetical protein FB446DRAFT_754784 [Lentinula raphanica]KAJ3842069.1 hypothetical protein F5878DRAFT_424294 [Lentinula raphanica]KAJ3969118.1 hypothetical protein EV361DRAFT_370675 [Lentinula raphanica]
MPAKSTSSSCTTSRPEQSVCSPTSPKQGSPRRSSSLRLCKTKAAVVPIPPSLLQSPHLSSPMSPFQKASSTSTVPSPEDEQWLRDTIPLCTSSTTTLGRSSSLNEGTRSRTAYAQIPQNGQNRADTTVSDGAMTPSRDRTMQMKSGLYSPPLVRFGGRQPSQGFVYGSTPDLIPAAEQGYFFIPRVGK